MNERDALYFLKGELKLAQKVSCLIPESERSNHLDHIDALIYAIKAMERYRTEQYENEELLKELNEFTKREHKAEEVFIFDVILCNNDVDRDGDMFCDSAIYELANKYKGVTGIFNTKQPYISARIFKTEVIEDPERITETGNVFKEVKAYAYMVRNASNVDFIKDIEAGIKKEVSISCSARKQVCSICGRDMLHDRCVHIKNDDYEGETCRGILTDIQDVYEWSFVTPPVLSHSIKY